MPSFVEVRDLLPRIVSELLLRHGQEWASLDSDIEEDDPGLVGSAACQYRGSKGFYVFLRTSGIGPERLVSARVLVDLPTPEEWLDIKAERTADDEINIGSGRHRYLYVPDEAERSARTVFAETEVTVVALSQVDS